MSKSKSRRSINEKVFYEAMGSALYKQLGYTIFMAGAKASVELGEGSSKTKEEILDDYTNRVLSRLKDERDQ